MMHHNFPLYEDFFAEGRITIGHPPKTPISRQSDAGGKKSHWEAYHELIRIAVDMML
jgi:hypothetical protein